MEVRIVEDSWIIDPTTTYNVFAALERCLTSGEQATVPLLQRESAFPQRNDSNYYTEAYTR